MCTAAAIAVVSPMWCSAAAHVEADGGKREGGVSQL